MVVAVNGGSHHKIGENDHVLRARLPAESQQPAALRRTSESCSASSDAAAPDGRRPSGGAATRDVWMRAGGGGPNRRSGGSNGETAVGRGGAGQRWRGGWSGAEPAGEVLPHAAAGRPAGHATARVRRHAHQIPAADTAGSRFLLVRLGRPACLAVSIGTLRLAGRLAAAPRQHRTRAETRAKSAPPPA